MYEDFTPEYLKHKILENTDTSISRVEGSFAHDMASGVAYSLHELWQEMGALYSVMFFDGLIGEYLDKRAAEYGLARTQGKRATGSITILTNFDTTIPAGTYFTSESGYEYVTTEAVTTENNTATVGIEAENIGAAYNALNIEVMRLTVSVPGVVAGRLSGDITGGADEESDEGLRERLYNQIRAAGSGCTNDYITWAKEVPGVGAVQVIPRWNGAGAVKVLISSGAYEAASEELIAAVAEHVDAKRPIGAVVTVDTVTAIEIDVSAAVVLKPGYESEDVNTVLNAVLTEYLRECAMNNWDVKYNRIGALLMSIEGVLDYSDLTVNNGTANVTIESGHMPVCGMVTLT